MLAPIFIAVFLFFIAFTIGVNLGMHGVLLFGDGSATGRLSIDGVVFHASSLHDVGATGASGTTVNANEKPIDTKIFTKDINMNVADAVHSEAKDIPPPPEPVDNTLNSKSDKDNSNLNGISQSVQSFYNAPSYQNILSKEISYAKTRQLEKSFALDGNYPVLLMACNRPDVLKQTIESLLSVRGMSKSNILVSQDGNNGEVSALVRNQGLELVQNTDGLKLRGGRPPDGAQRIAMHYKFSLTSAFAHWGEASAIIVVEDDLLFAPDFLEYFQSAAPALELDSSLFAISAWNDNGFKGKVMDPYTLHRTEFFPGLGWLLTRNLYKGELESAWPKEHWDHWLRSKKTHKGREIVYPQVPRTYHNGIKGTFMNLDTHNKYFRDIATNHDESVNWLQLSSDQKSAVVGNVLSIVYEKRVEDMIRGCTSVSSLSEMLEAKGVVCVWINVNPDPPDYSPPEFQTIAGFFGIWHEHKRGGHRGLHEFYWENDKYIMLLNTHDSLLHSYKELQPSNAKILKPEAFNKNEYLRFQRNRANFEMIKASEPNLSCTEVCLSRGKTCSQPLLQSLNDCPLMKSNFPCDMCTPSQGQEQPAYVPTNAEAQFMPNRCLVNNDPSQSICDAKHQSTIRLCACVETN